MSLRLLPLLNAIIGFSMKMLCNLGLMFNMFQFLFMASLTLGRLLLYVRTHGILVIGVLTLYFKSSSLGFSEALLICGMMSFLFILWILAFRSGYHWTVWIQDRYCKFFIITVLVHTECSSSDGMCVQIGNEDMDVYRLVLYTISYQYLCRWSDQGSLPLFFKYCSRILCGDELCWFPLEIFLVPYIYIYNGFIKHCDLIKRLGISIQNIALY